MDLGRYGAWLRSADVTPEVGVAIEGLGYGAFWIGGSPPGELHEVEAVIAATEHIPVATGIVNMWRARPETVAAAFHRVEAAHPGRLILGLGIGHPESSSEYRRPYETMVDYLDILDGEGVPGERVVLAALGPKVLRLAADRTAGAHPYLTTPRHTRMAKEVMGGRGLLAPEQTVVVGLDPDRAAELARSFVGRYLRLVNYRNSLLREGWEEEDLLEGGSDRLVAELVLTGSLDHVASGIDAHLSAGADHVPIQPLGPDPVAAFEALGGALGLQA